MFSAGLLKLQSACPRKQGDGKNFRFLLYQYPALREKCSSVSGKNFAGITELVSKSPYHFFEENIFSWTNRFFDLLRTWVVNFPNFCWFSPAGLSKLLSTCPYEQFEQILFLEKMSSRIIFRLVESYYWFSYWNFPVGLPKLLPTSAYGFSWKKKFWELILHNKILSSMETSPILAEVSGKIAKSAIYVSHRRIWRKFFELFFILFPHSSVSRKFSGQSIFFDEKTLNFFSSFLDLQRKNSVCSSEDLWWGSHNCIFSIGTV